MLVRCRCFLVSGFGVYLVRASFLCTVVVVPVRRPLFSALFGAGWFGAGWLGRAFGGGGLGRVGWGGLVWGVGVRGGVLGRVFVG